MLKRVSGGSGVEVARWACSETLAPTFAFPFLAIFSLRLRSTHVISLSASHRACRRSCGFPSTDYFAPLMHLLLPWGREHDQRPEGTRQPPQANRPLTISTTSRLKLRLHRVSGVVANPVTSTCAKHLKCRTSVGVSASKDALTPLRH